MGHVHNHTAACSIPRTATCALWCSDSLSTSYSSIWHIPCYNISAQEQKSQRSPLAWRKLSRWSPYHFSPNLLPFFLDWFSKWSVTPIMQVYQPYQLNDSCLFSGFQHHCKTWKKLILMRCHNDRTLLPAYTEIESGELSQTACPNTWNETNKPRVLFSFLSTHYLDSRWQWWGKWK